MFNKILLLIGLTAILSACNEPDNAYNDKNDRSKTAIKKPIAKEKTCSSSTDYMVKTMYGPALIRTVKNVFGNELYNSYKKKYQSINGDFNRNRVNAAETCKLLDKLYEEIDSKLKNVDVSKIVDVAKIKCNTRSQYMELSQRTDKIIRSTAMILPLNDHNLLVKEYKGIVTAYKNDPLHQNDVLQQSDLTHQNKACKLMLNLTTRADAQVLATLNK